MEVRTRHNSLAIFLQDLYLIKIREYSRFLIGNEGKVKRFIRILNVPNKILKQLSFAFHAINHAQMKESNWELEHELLHYKSKAPLFLLNHQQGILRKSFIKIKEVLKERKYSP